jgi:hypothetical protein
MVTDIGKPIIRRREAAIYELIQKGVRPQVIAHQHGYGETKMYRILRRLEEMKFVKRAGRGVYHALIGAYEIMDDQQSSRSGHKSRNGESIEPFTHVKLTERERAYLLQTYYQLKRSEIASKLGKPRYVICREAISMGIAQD